MKKLSIDLAQYATQEEGIEATKQFLLGHGYTIIQYSPRYFDYSKNDRFGHFTVDSYGAFSLSSCYKPSRQNGTGCQTVDHEWKFNIAQFENTMNNTQHCRDRVTFYRDIADRVANHWAKDKDTFEVIYPPTPQSDSDRLGFDNGSE
jgi:hypothetical protein